MSTKILTKTMSIFKKKTSPKEALRESKRDMATATRGIEREIAALQLEKKLVAEIKKTAKAEMRLYMLVLRCHWNERCNEAMTAMNKQMAPTKQAKVIKEFQKQSAQMDMTIEMMSEAIDETLDKDEAEEETEELTNQVLDEIGVDIASQLSSAPKGRIASRNTPNVVSSTPNVVPSTGSTDVEDLEKRLASLRRI